ncbi:MAG: hypothetical protein BGO82_03020 [Devosia sp. 67-54]|nr:MAG: hypothetical protein BGO82_03020 [Devosia sp. 67-54]
MLFMVGAAHADAPRLRGVALVVGEADYAALPKLGNPGNDARAMDDLLDKLGFDVTRVLDADGDKLREKIARFVEDAADADVALIYYSGHGFAAGGQNYLVPVDADLSSPQAAGADVIEVSQLLDRLARTVPVTIALLDACRSELFPAGLTVQPPGAPAPLPIAPSGLGELRGPVPLARPGVSADSLGMVIGFAAAPGQPALDGAPGEENSPYAAALLKHLGAGGYSFADVMTMVSEEVYLKTRARQLPWVNSSLRRVLQFGRPIVDKDPDEAAIKQGRRDLLLSIAATPDATRAYVETVATSQAVPLDALYGMLDVLGVDTGKGQADLESQLREGALQLKALLAQQPGAVKQDDELRRLSGLADRAQQEGAIGLALKYRAAASARAEDLAKQRDALEDQLKSDRLELGQTFAEHAQTAMLNFDYRVAAGKFAEALAQVDRWDEALAVRYGAMQALALSRLGRQSDEGGALAQALALYPHLLSRASTAGLQEQWSAIESDYGIALAISGERSSDPQPLEAAVTAFQAAAEGSGDDPALRAVALSGLGNALWDLAGRTGDAPMAERALATYREALARIDRQQDAYGWGMMQTSIGNVLQTLATLEGDSRFSFEAIAALRDGLAALGEARSTTDWATTAGNLAAVLISGFNADHDRAHMTEAFGLFDAVLELRPRETMPLDWGITTINLGAAQLTLAEADNSADEVKQAAETFRGALGALPRETVPFDWALAEAGLGHALVDLGTLGDQSVLEQAIASFRAALEVRTRAAAPALWARSMNDLGWALGMHGVDIGDKAMVEEGRSDVVEARDYYAAQGQLQDYFAQRLATFDQILQAWS